MFNMMRNVQLTGVYFPLDDSRICIIMFVCFGFYKLHYLQDTYIEINIVYLFLNSYMYKNIEKHNKIIIE